MALSELVWAGVALVACGLSYDVLRRWMARDSELGVRCAAIECDVLSLTERHGDLARRHAKFRNVTSEQLASSRAAHVQAIEMVERSLRAYVEEQAGRITGVRAELAEHLKDFQGLMLQWREEIGKMQARMDRVVTDANNEIAGNLAQVADMTKKGWR